MAEDKGYVLNVYDLPTAPNICNQILREVIRLQEVSMAHVTMEKGNVSLLHKHQKMKEVYFVLEGEGVLYVGERAFKVNKGAYVPIPLNTNHKLRNTGNANLEHLVFAIPPFTPEDIILSDGEREPTAESLVSKKQVFTALDGASVYELDTEKERDNTNVGFAFGFLPPKRKAKLHHHKISEEIYYVISGKGKVKLGKKNLEVKKGTLVYIPKKVQHRLENTDSEKLEILCVSSPFYREGDFIFERDKD